MTERERDYCGGSCSCHSEDGLAERYARVTALHQPTESIDYVAIPPEIRIVCGSCYAGVDDALALWPCPTARALGLE